MRKLFAAVAAAAGIAMSAGAQTALYPNEFPLSDVELTESRFSHARDLNVATLLAYDTDRLLAPYLKAAGLPPKGESFSCWDGLDGHVGGHYLTALAIHYAATGDERLKARMDYMVAELQRCADARGDGYVGGVPDGDPLWQRLREGDAGAVGSWWVPWYNVHKAYAGLRDAWLYGGSEKARTLFLGMCDWGIETISALSDEAMEKMLAVEFGGMNEVYADAYAMTGEKKYLDAARRFTHHALFDPLLRGEDRLDNLHANTQVPKVVGYQRVAELAADSSYAEAARFFWDTVVGHRTLSFGGNSRREHFAPADQAWTYVDDREGPESCNTNNMLKLTEGLFRMKPDARYADFYERALFNHILSTQHPGHGGYVYFTPARPGHYRVYSSPNAAMWCCVGTGMENHGKYGQFIYTRGADSLWVNLFIPSRLDWKEKGVKLTQTTSFPDDGETRLSVSADRPVRFALSLRHPGWADSVRVKVNGELLETDASTPASYLTLDREWREGDVVELSMPMKVSLSPLPDLPQYVSVMRGPIVMAARFDDGSEMPGLVADDSRWAHIAHGPLVSVFDTPLLIGERDSLVSALSAMQRVEGSATDYKAAGVFGGKFADIVLSPFSSIHDSRYVVYFLSMTPDEFAAYRDNAAAEEARRLALDRRTVDAVNFGEQQPEADHFMKAKNSRTGNYTGQAWRDASSGGHITVSLNTGGRTDLSLQLRHSAFSPGDTRKIDVTLDDILVATLSPEGNAVAEASLPDENLASEGSPISEFEESEIAIPAEVLQGKTNVTLTIAPQGRTSTGNIYHLHLLSPGE